MSTTASRDPQTAPGTSVDAGNIRTSLSADAIARALVDNLRCLQAASPDYATRNDWYMALAYTVRDRMLDRCIATVEAMASAQEPVKVVAYLSAEFLTGPHLGNSLITTAAYLVQPRSIVLLSRLLATPSDAGEKPWKLRSRTTRSPSIPSPNANWS